FSQDGSGTTYLYLTLSDSTGKQQIHRLLKADEETKLSSDFVQKLVLNKLDTLLKDELVVVGNSNFSLGENSTNVLTVFDDRQNVSHKYYFNFSTFMC